MAKHINGRNAPDLAIDFDGTIFSHEYPDIGKDIGAFPWLKKFQEEGCRLILYTMRHDSEGQGPVLTEAIEACRKNGIEFWAHNENPEQYSWTHSNKVYAQIYVDDNSIGTPLIHPVGGRPYVNWAVVGPLLLDRIKEWKARYE
jgi:hypothetical protein